MRKTQPGKTTKPITAVFSVCAAAVLCLSGSLGTPVALAAKSGWEGPVYETDFDSAQDALNAQREYNKTIAGEGYVLLKNEEYTYTTGSGRNQRTVTANSLPITIGGAKISVFGKNSVNPVYSGSGSSGGSGVDVSLLDALKNEGFVLNQTLIDFYNDRNASGSGRGSTSMSNQQVSYWNTGETPQSMYTDEVKDSYASYGDAAIIVFSRIGGEGADLPMSSFHTTEGGTSAVTNGTPTREDIDKEITGNGDWTPVGGSGRESNPFAHYLELDDNERALIKAIEESGAFENIIVVLNSLSAFEVKPLAEDENIKSIIWAAGAGMNGFDSLAKIISGKINPSGRTVDTLAADFTATPSFVNNSGYRIGSGLTTTSDLGNQYYMDDGTGNLVPFTGILSNGNGYDDGSGYYGNEYEEGIYVGYQYYETAAEENFIDYDQAVVYPFGYGLSYTDFEWTVGELKTGDTDPYGNLTYTIDVTVKNIGSVAGKDVVELYYEAPYIRGGIEKSKVTLGDFAKTKLLAPEESETVTLSVSAFDMASFDVYDKNNNGSRSYELDPGEYKLYVTTDSHGWALADESNTRSFTLSTEFVFTKDPHSGADIEVHFADMNKEMEAHVMSRADFAGTFPQTPYWFEVPADNTILDPFWSMQYRFIYGKNYDAADWENGATLTPVKDVPDDWSNTPKYLRKASADGVKEEEWLARLLMPFDYENENWSVTNAVFRSTYDTVDGQNKWYYTQTGTEEGAKQATYSFRDSSEAYTEAGYATIQFRDLAGKEYDDPIFDQFASQFKIEQAASSINGAFAQFKALKNLTAFGIVPAIHHDGPQGISGSFGAPNKQELNSGGSIKGNFAPETVVAGTWNKEIAYMQGYYTGQVALWNHTGGWYAPGVNMHRSQFGGRNFEYYSEDATLAGAMAENVIVGASQSGLLCFMKHFALNDQETARENNEYCVWADEQTVRQIYLRPFERAAKAVNNVKTSVGTATPAAFMTSFSRFGFEWAGGCWDLMNGLCRNEWGLICEFTTDAFQSKNGAQNANTMIRAGGDIGLDLRASSIGGVSFDFATVFGLTKNDAVYGEECVNDSHLQALYDSIKRQAYCLINSDAGLNGYAFSWLDDESTKNDGYTTSGYTAPQTNLGTALKGLPYSVSVADENLSDIQYRLYLGTMPDGLALDYETGMISGTINRDYAPGTYTLQILATAKGATSEQDKWVIVKNIVGNANAAITTLTLHVEETSVYDLIEYYNAIIFGDTQPDFPAE